METIAERRRRKLIALVQAHGGLPRLARACDLSEPALDQVIKRTLMQPKQDGTRSAKALGDSSARKIEDALNLGRGWFDADARAEPAAPEERDLIAEAMGVLALACSSLDKRTRLSIAPLFSSLATEPEDLKAIILTVKKLLPDQNLARESHPPKSTGTTIGGLGKLEDLKTDGQGIRVQTPQGKR